MRTPPFENSFAIHPRAKYWSLKNKLKPEDVFLKSNKRFMFDCDCGHEFDSILCNITNNNRWCGYCSNNKLCNNDCKSCFEKSFASHPKVKYWIDERNPRNFFKSCGKKFKFKCECGYIFHTTLNHISSSNHWCIKCGQKKSADAQRYTIEYVKKKIIKFRPGSKCLSDKYTKAANKLKLLCEKGHSFEMSYNFIQQGKWCPHCCTFKSEKKCREILEKIFNKSFIKCRPEWLYGLELDGYNKELNLAFEYNGKQHYEFIPLFHKTPDKLEKQQCYDVATYCLCDMKNIKLIIIPYTVKFEDLEDYIHSEIWRLCPEIV